MHLIDLFEARRNPEQNPKVNPYDKIVERLDSADTLLGYPNLFVSFTTVDKLGINPHSEYNTPIGIYSYPAWYVQQEGENSMDMLPFAGDSPFINVFSVNGVNVIHLNTVNESRVAAICRDIANLYASEAVAAGLQKSWKEAVDVIEELINSAGERAMFSKVAGGRLWYVSYKAKRLFANIWNTKEHIAWTRIFRKIGIDGFIDTGLGIIHTSEPTQAVFFSKDVIQNNERYLNKWSKMQREGGQDKLRRYEDDMALVREYGESVLLSYPGLTKYFKKLSPEIQNKLVEDSPTTLCRFSGSYAPGVEIKLINNLIELNGGYLTYINYRLALRPVPDDVLKYLVSDNIETNLFQCTEFNLQKVPENIWHRIIAFSPSTMAKKIVRGVPIDVMLHAAKMYGPEFYSNLTRFSPPTHKGYKTHTEQQAAYALYELGPNRDIENVQDILTNPKQWSTMYSIIQPVLSKWEPELVARLTGQS